MDFSLGLVKVVKKLGAKKVQRFDSVQSASLERISKSLQMKDWAFLPCNLRCCLLKNIPFTARMLVGDKR